MNSPFAQDWRDCLEANLQSLILTEDTRTFRSLSAELKRVGVYSKEQIEEISVKAHLIKEGVFYAV